MAVSLKEVGTSPAAEEDLLSARQGQVPFLCGGEKARLFIPLIYLIEAFYYYYYPLQASPCYNSDTVWITDK